MSKNICLAAFILMRNHATAPCTKNIDMSPFAQRIFVFSTIILALTFILFSRPAFAAKCLYISSYHKGYEWNDGIEKGLDTTLAGKCEIDKFYMDTNRNTDPEYAKKMALQAKMHIEKTLPDVVIACDDPASKYLVQPYFKDKPLAIVFCGVNWTVKTYGYPYSNVTGMIEMAPIKPMMREVMNILPGVKSGIYLTSDVITQHREFEFNRENLAQLGIALTPVYVKSMAQWKKALIAAQKSAFVYLGTNAGINDWNDNEAILESAAYTKKLTVTNYDWMAPLAMLSMTKVAEEQGEWSAQVALSILSGVKPASIPIVSNRRWNIYINPALAKKAGIKLPQRLSRIAIKIGK
jgi:ABC-type uncharacterized transport system substrate-binding protein